MQTCFFAISGVLPREQTIAQIKSAIRGSYGDKGEEVVQRNFEAVDDTLSRLHAVAIPTRVTSTFDRPPPVPASAPDFVRRVTAREPQQTLQAFRKAEAYEGPSLILAYCHRIAHGFDLRYGMRQQDLATASGYWPLFRYNPAMCKVGESPFRLDSPRPTLPLKDYAYNELRYRALSVTRPAEAAALLQQAQTDILEKYRSYEEFASLDRGPTPSQAATAQRKP